MASYTMLVASSAKPGREDDYARWYDEVHMKDICSVTGVKSGRKLIALADKSPNPPPGGQIAIYEVDVDDPASILAEIGQRSGSGEFKMTDAIDLTSAKIWFYR